ncbi:sensor histidine kinase [Tenacibaculum amylolyticum]|uniref:sensor histidine kinase n=1 Tax=Tenacibaculum amylolyticum TaxID=104269 RepID=UPI0038B43637
MNKRYLITIFSLVLLLVSIIGMLIMKSEIEYNTNTNGELYFSIFRVLFFTVLIVFIGDWLFRKWKEYQQLKNEKLMAELNNLKSQISPHFFFNTLNNLYGLIKKDTDKSREFVLKLSDLMRYSIYNSETETVSLEEEINYLENFIALHEIRYFNTITIDFKKEVQEKNLRIAPLLLIILIENAFKHGAEKLTDNAFIHLQLKTIKGKLLFSVENNFDKHTITKTNGLGLKNLRKRLELLYPDKHSFTITSTETIFKTALELEL